MAYVGNTHRTSLPALTQNAFSGYVSALVISTRARIARRRVYRQTLRELSALSTRELQDLGLSRSEIRRVAWQAANDL